MPDTTPQKVAILGGGAGSMSTALYLTNPENAGKFDITIYQMGWRLGGLGASGRNMEKGGRIEEHGLHLWGGFYENAFNMMLQIYKEAARPAGSPLSVVFDPGNANSTIAAFKPFSNVVFGDYYQNRWSMWKIVFPENEHLPGVDDSAVPDLSDMISEIIDIFWQQIQNVLGGSKDFHPEPGFLEKFGAFLHKILPFSEDMDTKSYEGEVALIRHSMATITHLWQMFHPTDPRHRSDALPHLISAFDHIAEWIWLRIGDLSTLTDAQRHLWELLDINLAVIRGLMSDNVVENGFEPLDAYDMRDWLKIHGASELTLNSVLVRGFYDYFFAMVDGDPNHPRLSAGSALVHMMRLVYTYKGSIFWKMQAGMGDTIFAPAYEVLKKRGVKFEFFHFVENLSLGPDHKTVEQIQIQRQVYLKPEVKEYQPFVTVKDLACWPNQPNWDQIVDGDIYSGKKRDPNIPPSTHADVQIPLNLEDPWNGYKGVGKVVLEHGKDFDILVLAMSKDALTYNTLELQEASPSWKRMLRETLTVDTIAAQVWFNNDSAAMGWTDPPSVLTGYQRPHSTWCEMSHLLPREDWPENGPKALTYMCGPVWRPTAAQNPLFEPNDDEDFTIVNKIKSATLTREWMLSMLGMVYPKASLPVNPSGIDFIHVYDPTHRTDLGRLDYNYIRINVTPQERYTLSVPGAQEIRIRDARTPFTNVYAAGDYVYTLLAGCVEAAVMSGMLVSRTLTGYPEKIPGYWVKPKPTT